MKGLVNSIRKGIPFILITLAIYLCLTPFQNTLFVPDVSKLKMG